ncbi:MAG TPA: hypothetical protein VER97_07110 [Geodermatophilus sp.]|nr:hypothetical protein [Geodermatophilus sp.]
MTPIAPGETADLAVLVTEAMTVDFDRLSPVHPVYATYTMAKPLRGGRAHAATGPPRAREAGIGTAVSVEHVTPA